MKWYAVGQCGTEYSFTVKPIRWNNGIIQLWTTKGKGERKELDSGTIKKVVGKEMTWFDEPIKIQ